MWKDKEMNDRFRFRAWDNREEKYIYDAQDQYDDKVECFGNMFDTYGDRYVVEQCTGLKDKNDKLIYEGDVVEIIDRENSSTLDRIYPMLFNEKVAKFGYKHHDGQFFYHSNNDDYSYEVIGNIHENPEMIDENY